MSTVIREAIVKVKLETSGSDKFVFPGLAEAKKLLVEYEAAIREATKAKGQASAASAEGATKLKAETQVSADAAKAERDRAAAIKAAVAQDEQRRAATLRSAEALKTAGDGAFTFARGLALLGVSADSDLARVAAQIARVQAGFDLYKGSVDVVKGVTESIEGLTQATGAQTKAQALLIAGSRAFAGVFGPTGLLVAGLGVLAAATVKVYSDWSASQRQLEEDVTASIRRTRAEARAAEVSRLASRQAGGDARVATAQAALNLAQQAGDPEGLQRAQAALEAATIAALRDRGRALFEQGLRPGLSGQEFSQNLIDRSQTTADLASARSTFEADRAGRTIDNLNKRREEARRLLEERKQLQQELEELQSRDDPNDPIGADPRRFIELTSRLQDIDAKDPAKILADATAKVLEVQESALKAIEDQQAIVAKQQATIESIRARQELMSNQLDSAPRD